MIRKWRGETGKGRHLIKSYKMSSGCEHLELCLAGKGGGWSLEASVEHGQSYLHEEWRGLGIYPPIPICHWLISSPSWVV